VYQTPHYTSGAENITIKIKDKNDKVIYLHVTDAMGRLMHSQRIDAVPVSNYITNLNSAQVAARIIFFPFYYKSQRKGCQKSDPVGFTYLRTPNN
jgi:hypothetical protein